MTLVVDNSTPAPAARSYRRRSYRRRSYRRPRYSRRRMYRRRFPRRFRGITSVQQLPKFVAAQVDPFNDFVDGVKIPDSNTYPSCALRICDTYSALTTDANGLIAYAGFPNTKCTFVNHTAATSSSWTWAAAFGGQHSSDRQTSLAANYGLYRPVAHGIRISCSGAPTSVTGNVHVAIVSNDLFGKTTWNLPTNLTQLSNAMFYRKYPLAQFTQQSLTVVNKFMDCTSQRYIDCASDGAENATDFMMHFSGWGAIIIVVESAPATTAVLNLENVLHIEAIPLASGLDNGSPAAPFNTRILEEVSRMAGRIPGAFTEQETPSYFAQISSSVGQGMRSYGEQMFYRSILPAAARVGYAAAGLAARRVFGIPGVTDFRNRSAWERLT